MARSISQLEMAHILLLKYIEGVQPILKPLDVTKTFEEWPAVAGAALSARSIAQRLSDVGKDAVKRGLVGEDFKMPCSNYSAKKGKAGGQRRQRAAASKKRARDESEDVMEEAADNAEGGSKENTKVATSDQQYPSPPTTGRTKSRSSLMAAASGAATQTFKGTTAYQETELDDNHASDSDSDSLADLEDTPTKSMKRQRSMPDRRSRVTTKYFADDDADAGEVEESDEEFDPYKMREEQRKKEARRTRMSRYADGSDEE